MRKNEEKLLFLLRKIRKFGQSGLLVPSSQSGQLPTSSFPHLPVLSTTNKSYNSDKYIFNSVQKNHRYKSHIYNYPLHKYKKRDKLTEKVISS